MPAAGPADLSMQAVAREAKASMETLYSWYGDKTGLYQALVADNAVQIEVALIEAKTADPVAMLEDIGERLFDMVTSERAVALNRAAAADPSAAFATPSSPPPSPSSTWSSLSTSSPTMVHLTSRRSPGRKFRTSATS